MKRFFIFMLGATAGWCFYCGFMYLAANRPDLFPFCWWVLVGLAFVWGATGIVLLISPRKGVGGGS